MASVLKDRYRGIAYDHRGQRKSVDGAGQRSLPYVIHSNEECERLELQARLANIQGHLRHLPISANDRVLDVGCGSGSMSRLIARSFPQAEVVGVDLREQYVDFAKARSRDEGIRNVTFRGGDAVALPFADASFDVVWTKYLLQWLKEPKSAVAELKRVAKPGLSPAAMPILAGFCADAWVPGVRLAPLVLRNVINLAGMWHSRAVAATGRMAGGEGSGHSYTLCPYAREPRSATRPIPPEQPGRRGQQADRQIRHTGRLRHQQRSTLPKI
jgi:SAM-dependent methyltransferase